MTGPGASSSPEKTAAHLRAEFDAGFAAPEPSVDADRLDLLAFRIGGLLYAVPLSDLVSLHAHFRIVPVPGAGPELLGITGVRGQLVTAYDLGRLLGHVQPHGVRWLVLCAREPRIAMAFGELEGRLSVSRDAIRPAVEGARHASGALPDPQGARQVVDLSSILSTLREPRATPEPRK